MRLDKYLKVSRLIKRRSVADEACSTGHVSLNGKVAKSSAEVSEGDLIEIRFGERLTAVRVTRISEFAPKGEAMEMYEIIKA